LQDSHICNAKNVLKLLKLLTSKQYFLAKLLQQNSNLI